MLYLKKIIKNCMNDAVFGYKNDFAWQKYIQWDMLESLVRRTGQTILAGSITWQVGSLHVYSRHFNYITDYLAEKTQP